MSSSKEQLVSSLKDANEKVASSLISCIEEHTSNEEFDHARDGLDFLEVKNNIFLTYLIELTQNVRQQLLTPTEGSGNIARLTELKIIIDKMRPLEKRMRYGIDKLISMGTAADTFASNAGGDPLYYAPDPKALQDDDDSGGSEKVNEDESSSSTDEDDDDEELQAAKATLERARKSQKDEKESQEVYKAPRMTAVPYREGGDEEEAKRLTEKTRKRLRTSELVQALRSDYADVPEQEDSHGGTDYGKQREASRRLAEREAERTAYEEDAMVRLTTTRKEKKQRQKLLRDEGSNLRAIADLGNLTRGVQVAFSGEKGKRGEILEKPRRKKTRPQGKNSFQRALYGTDKKSKKKK